MRSIRNAVFQPRKESKTYITTTSILLILFWLLIILLLLQGWTPSGAGSQGVGDRKKTRHTNHDPEHGNETRRGEASNVTVRAGAGSEPGRRKGRRPPSTDPEISVFQKSLTSLQKTLKRSFKSTSKAKTFKRAFGRSVNKKRFSGAFLRQFKSYAIYCYASAIYCNLPLRLLCYRYQLLY